MKGSRRCPDRVIAGPLIGLTMSPITPTKASYLMGGEAGHNDPPSLHIHNQLTEVYIVSLYSDTGYSSEGSDRVARESLWGRALGGHQGLESPYCFVFVVILFYV